MGKDKECCRIPRISIELLQDYCTGTQLDDWEEGEERKRNKKCFENVRNVDIKIHLLRYTSFQK